MGNRIHIMLYTSESSDISFCVSFMAALPDLLLCHFSGLITTVSLPFLLEVYKFSSCKGLMKLCVMAQGYTKTKPYVLFTD